MTDVRTLRLPSDIEPPSRFAVGSSPWWIERLAAALFNRYDRFTELEEYYQGEQDLSRLAGAAWRESELAAMFPKYLHANHSTLIVDGTAHRLAIVGFRLAGELRADTAAASIWRRNQMDALSDGVHVEALVKGECPVLVEPDLEDPPRARITPQDPRHTIVWHGAGDRRVRLAALKTWWDADLRRRFYILYRPDWIEHWQDRAPGQMDPWLNRLFGSDPAPWEPRWMPRGESWRIPNPLGVVPVVVVPNAPRLFAPPRAEHASVLGRIDHYNKTLMDMAVTSHELAYPQRYGIGVDTDEGEPEVDEATGEPVPGTARPAAQTGQTRWITTPNDAAQFGQFAVAQLDNYVKELDQIRADVATDTFMPYHFLLNLPSSVAPSGDALTALEAPLVDKVRRRHLTMGSAWKEVLRLAFLVEEDRARADAVREGHVDWRDPESRSEAQHADALGKMRQMLGVPEEATWELLPQPPEEIERWRAMKREAEEAAAAAPSPQAAAADIEAIVRRVVGEEMSASVRRAVAAMATSEASPVDVPNSGGQR